MHDIDLILEIDTLDPPALASCLTTVAWLPTASPDRAVLDYRRRDTSDWRTLFHEPFREDVTVSWSSANLTVSVPREKLRCLFTRNNDGPAAVAPLDELLSFIAAAPVAWGLTHDVRGWSRTALFLKRMMGTLMFFKGPSHEKRLVSRRWLEHGPWVMRRYANDLSVVFFHDLDAPDALKTEQATPGHVRMGEGFLTTIRGYELPPHASYLTDERRLEIAVYGRDVSSREMTDARWIVVDQGLGPSQPLDKVTYTFADPREAQKHLHEMWLREIEVVTFVEGKRTVLTDGYAPAPRPPEWASRASASLEAEGL